jgi:hypothetical protein
MMLLLNLILLKVMIFLIGYNSDRYEEGGRSTLGNSCTVEMSSDTFEIYTENTEVCELVILDGEDSPGSMKDW